MSDILSNGYTRDEQETVECFRNCYKDDTGHNPPWDVYDTIAKMDAYLEDRRKLYDEMKKRKASAVTPPLTHKLNL